MFNCLLIWPFSFLGKNTTSAVVGTVILKCSVASDFNLFCDKQFVVFYNKSSVGVCMGHKAIKCFC